MADDILDEADEFIQNGGYAGPLVRKMRDEIERLRLTDAEREAIKAAIACCEDITYGSEAEPEAAATLRALLARCAIGSE